VTTDSEHFAPMRDSTALLGDPDKLRAQFEQDGYVYLRGVLDRQKVMKLRGFYFGMFDQSYFADGTAPDDGIWSGSVPAGQLPQGVDGPPAHHIVRHLA